jgi:preprotein translocase subunit YajC
MPVSVVSDTPTRLAAIRCADVRYVDRKATIVYNAEGTSSGGGSGALQLLLIVGFFVLIYFMMIRPQQRRRREVQEMQSSMGVGDTIVTVGGLYGTVVEAGDETVLLDIAPGVTAKYARQAIAKVVEKAAVPAEEEPALTAEDEPVSKPDAD